MLLIIISTYYGWWLGITQLVLFGGYLFFFFLMASLIIKKIAVPFKNHFLTIGLSCLVFVIGYSFYLVKMEERASEGLLFFLIFNGVIVWISSFYLLRIIKRYYTDGQKNLINPRLLIKRQKVLKQNINQLEQLSSELASQNKQLTDFAHITSHNLRSPMASITALFELY
jgi:signal transduction histidine kinase